MRRRFRHILRLVESQMRLGPWDKLRVVLLGVFILLPGSSFVFVATLYGFWWITRRNPDGVAVALGIILLCVTLSRMIRSTKTLTTTQKNVINDTDDSAAR